MSLTNVLPAIAAALTVIAVTSATRPRRARRPDGGATTSSRGRTTRVLEAAVDAVEVRRSRTLRPDAVADWCDDLARRSRSGSSLTSAIAGCVPGDAAARRATDPIRTGLARGRAVVDAIGDAGSVPLRSGGEHLVLACSVIAVIARLGGPAGAPLDRAAAALRLRAADLHERAAQSAQARLSAHVLTGVPLLVLATLLVFDPDVRTTITQPLGATCLGLGLTLNITGWWWMQRVIGS